MILFRVLWICLGLQASLGHNNFQSAYVKSPLKQLVTSNSLRWEYAKKPHDWVKDTRVVLLNGVAACKGTYKGVSVIGSAKRSNGHCYVELNGSLHALRSKFYVLIQRIKASRLLWSPWDIFTKIPNSSVAYNPKTFVARSEDANSKGHYSFGSLNPDAGLSGEISVFGLRGGNRKIRSSTKGAILVEDEPVRYELKDVEYIQRRQKILNESRVVLGKKTFSNPGDEEGEEDGSWNSIVSVLSFNSSHTYNWGQNWGLITALPSRAPTPGGSQDDFPLHDFEWGLPLSLHKHELLEVSRFLQAKTATEASIVAWKTSSEIPYRARLVSIYEDGSSTTIWIDGSYSETVLKKMEVVFEDPYFIRNGSQAPTTTTTTTEPPSTMQSLTKVSTEEDVVFKVKNPRHASKGYVQDIPVGERYYSLLSSSSSTTRNPLYRFYPPDDEKDESKEKNSLLFNPKTFSLRNSGEVIFSQSLPLMILGGLLLVRM